MTEDELRQLIASNARAIQAAADERAEIRQAILDLRETILVLREANVRLAEIQGGMINLVGSLDEDRPTVLRKLNTIENKIDQLLEKRNENHE
jgi:chromosome segregation ATPase